MAGARSSLPVWLLSFSVHLPPTVTIDPLGAEGEIFALETLIANLLAPSQTVLATDPAHTVAKKTSGVDPLVKLVPIQATSRLPSPLKSPTVGSAIGVIVLPVLQGRDDFDAGRRRARVDRGRHIGPRIGDDEQVVEAVAIEVADRGVQPAVAECRHCPRTEL